MIDIKAKSVAELRELNRRRMLRVMDIPEYSVWANMKTRCGNPNHHHYRDWGGRGITVCEEWKRDFWAWFEHIGRRPIAGLTQERINNDKGYEPGNVRWESYKHQSENKRPRTWPGGKTSIHEGVSLSPNRTSGKKWRARILVNGCMLDLHYFTTEADAAIAWNIHCAYYGLPKPLNAVDVEDYIRWGEG
jgi:hypothetical protein